MAINVASFTSTLRKQGLTTLLQNMNINFLEIKNRIYSYCNSDGDTYNTLLDMFYIKSNSMSSSEINATILLLYLDFYSNYVSLHSLYENYKGLVDVSKSKYIYLDSIIKDLNYLIDKKDKAKINKYVNSIDFTNTSQISLYKSDITSRAGSILQTLDIDPILSLPINTSKELSPYNIIPISKNSTENYEEIVETYSNDIYYNLIRTDNDYVCVVSSIADSNKNISKSLLMDISGVVTDIDLSNVYIKVSSIIDSTVKITCSSNSEEWSSEIEIVSGANYNLLIEEDIDTGLTFNLTYDITIKENDTWLVYLNRIQLPYPSTKFKILFNTFNDISLIKLNDISNYRLFLNSINTNKRKSTVKETDYYTNNNRVLVFPNEAISELDVDFMQKDSCLYNSNGSIGYNYTYYLSDIKAYSNEYIQQGNKSFNKIEIEEVNNIKVISDEYIYKPTENYLPKMFVEYNLYIEMDLDKILIPTLKSVAASGYVIDEYLIPSSINESNTAFYKGRFPVDFDSTIYLLNLSDNTTEVIYQEGINQELSYTVLDYSFVNISIRDFDSSKQYAIRYSPKIYKSTDTYDLSAMTNWVKDSKLYYMYYRDIDNNIRIALKTLDKDNYIIPITGSVSSFIEMRSIEEVHLSPYILKYAVICN